MDTEEKYFFRAGLSFNDRDTFEEILTKEYLAGYMHGREDAYAEVKKLLED